MQSVMRDEIREIIICIYKAKIAFNNKKTDFINKPDLKNKKIKNLLKT